VQSERDVVPDINIQDNVPEMIQQSSKLSTRRFSSHIIVLHIQVWQTVHEEYLHPFHDQRAQHLEPGDLTQRVDLCNWIKAYRPLRSIVFTGKVSVTQNGIIIQKICIFGSVEIHIKQEYLISIRGFQ
jgi:hypothetical protein